MRPWLGVAIALLLVTGACGPARPIERAEPSPTASARPTPTPARVLTLHWMSMAMHDEPRNRLLFEGGQELSFSSVRVVAPDGSVIGSVDAVPSSGAVLNMCAQSAPGTFGPLRATVVLPTQQLLSDVIRNPDAYRVEAGGSG